MKYILFLLIVSEALSATAQTRDTTIQLPVVESYGDSVLPRWVIDVNGMGGGLSQNLGMANSAGNYLNGVNVNQGKLTFNNGSSFGFDGQLGVFFGKKRHWGIGTGITYLFQQGNVNLNNYHAEYESTDANGNIYRQVVSPDNKIREQLKITNINIPLLLKYKNRFSERWGFTADAGLLFNVQMRNDYTTNASFDYEAYYDYTNVNYGTPTIYDKSSTPLTTDFLITKAAYAATDHGGNVQNWFNLQKSLGYGVALNQKPNSNTGSVSYKMGSLGFMLRPAISYYLSDNVALNFGLYYLFQAVNNSATKGYTLTKGIGDYSSSLNNVTKSQDQSYGLNVGIRFLLGKKLIPLAISSEEAIGPTACGLSDGMIVLQVMPTGKDVTVNYNMNTQPAQTYTVSVAADGKVKLPMLAAGSYSGITVTSGKHLAKGVPVSLLNPPMAMASEFSANPTAPGACDGTITMTGLKPGQHVTVDYDFNGVPHTTNSNSEMEVSQDKKIVLQHLCSGSYTHIVVKTHECTTNGFDMNLTDPYVSQTIKTRETVETERVEPTDPDIFPIRFEVNKNTVHPISYPALMDAVKRMNEEKGLHAIVSGYTDASGIPSKNRVLSLIRAKAVKAELVRLGVDPNRIKIVGKGASDPIGSNKTVEGKAMNRRAVIRLVASK